MINFYNKLPKDIKQETKLDEKKLTNTLFYRIQ